MRDSIGNKIEKDCLMQWQIPESVRTRLVFQVYEVSDGGLSLGGSEEEDSPPRLIVTFSFPLTRKGLRSGEEPQLPDVYVLPNPMAQKALEDLMAGKKN